MSDQHHIATPSESGEAGRILSKLAAPAALVGIIATAVVLFQAFQPGKTGELMMGSFLYGWGFWLSMTLGMFGLTLLHHMVRGQWTLSILRFLEAGGGITQFVMMFLLFIPLLIQPKILYSWADPSYVAGDAIMLRKQWFLFEPGWQIRIAIVFFMFAWIAWGFRNSTLRQDSNRNFKLEAGRSSWAAVCFCFFMLASTLLVTDLFMTLEAHWFSTMYGPWQLVAAGGGALALCIGLLCLNSKKEPFKDIVFPGLTRDVGNMMFAFTMLWGYTTVSQFLIIWNGNIPEFTQYFAKRSSGMHPPGMEANNWGVLGMALIAGRFFIPFFLLLAPRTKRYTHLLVKVVGWIFVMHILDTYMLIIPAMYGRPEMGPISSQTPWDFLALIGVGGLWLSTFAWQLQKAPVLVKYDNRLQEAKAHAH